MERRFRYSDRYIFYRAMFDAILRILQRSMEIQKHETELFHCSIFVETKFIVRHRAVCAIAFALKLDEI